MASICRRDTPTVSQEIQRDVAPGTRIITDEWAAYRRIPALQDAAGLPLSYAYLTVNHSQQFVNPKKGAHTQNIESAWGATKALLVCTMKGWSGQGANTVQGRAEADRMLQRTWTGAGGDLSTASRSAGMPSWSSLKWLKGSIPKAKVGRTSTYSLQPRHFHQNPRNCSCVSTHWNSHIYFDPFRSHQHQVNMATGHGASFQLYLDDIYIYFNVTDNVFGQKTYVIGSFHILWESRREDISYTSVSRAFQRPSKQTTLKKQPISSKY